MISKQDSLWLAKQIDKMVRFLGYFHNMSDDAALELIGDIVANIRKDIKKGSK